MIRTNEASEKYRKLYLTQREKIEKYEKKDYNRRMTPRDIKKAESSARFTFNGIKLGEKHMMLIIVMALVLLIFIDSSFPNKSFFMIGSYGLIFIMLYIAFLYDVTKKFYWILISIFLITYLFSKNYSFLDWKAILKEKNNLNSNKK